MAVKIGWQELTVRSQNPLSDAEMHIVNLCMISPKYLRCWQTDYGTESRTGELLYEAQEQYFIDKDKGIRLSKMVSDH